jgi:hypothetical protein
MPEVAIDLKEGCRLIVGEFNGEDYYYYDLIGAQINPFERRGVMPTIVWVENKVVKILRHVAVHINLK